MNLKIILLDHQNNYVERLTLMNNAAKSIFNIVTTRTSYIIILMVQTKLSLDLYLTKFLIASAKPFFPYMIVILSII